MSIQPAKSLQEQKHQDPPVYEISFADKTCPLCCEWSCVATISVMGIICLPCIPCMVPVYMKSRHAYLSERHLHYDSGVLVKEKRTIPLDRIQDVRLTAGLIDQCFGIQNLVIETAGGTAAGVPEARLYAPVDPEGVKQKIMAQRDLVVYGSQAPMSSKAMQPSTITSATAAADNNTFYLQKIYESLQRIESYMCLKSASIDQITSSINEMSSDAPADAETFEKPKMLLEATNEVEVKLADPKASLYSATAFEELHLAPEILKGVYAMGYEKPSKIQAKALPLLMSTPFKNFIGQSQSGTGKTAAFVLAILSRVDPSIPKPQAIVLAPARELAVQILDVVKKMSQFTKISSAPVVRESVQRGASVSEHVLVGTPGTIKDLLQRRALPADSIRIFVIDEADIMLDRQGMGDQTIRIRRFLPKECQVVLFSATYKEEVRMFAERVVPDANMISLKREELSVDAIKQMYLDCNSEEKKYETLCSIYGLCNIGQSIIFCDRVDTADKIAARMQQDGHQVSVLHGRLEAADRDRIFNSYREGTTKVLITTNVMARGIDVLDVNLVINYDLPRERGGSPDMETYLHRIGRTGRFGRRGISINFVHDQRSLRDNQAIEKYFGKPITRVATDDLVTLEKELKDALKNR